MANKIRRDVDLKRDVIKHIKNGIQHFNPNYSIEVYRMCKEIRMKSKNIDTLSLKELRDLLRKTRKCVSTKWIIFNKWHKKCLVNDTLLFHRITS